MTWRAWQSIGVFRKSSSCSMQISVRQFASGKPDSKARPTTRNMTDEFKMAWREKLSAAVKATCARKTDEQKALAVEKRRATMAEWSPEQKGAWRENVRATWAKKTDEEREIVSEKRRARFANMTDEEKAIESEKRRARMKAHFTNMTDEERAIEREKRRARAVAAWARKTPEERLIWVENINQSLLQSSMKNLKKRQSGP